MSNDVCFKCREPGHWASKCPNSAARKAPAGNGGGQWQNRGPPRDGGGDTASTVELHKCPGCGGDIRCQQCKYASKAFPHHTKEELCYFNCTNYQCQYGKQKNATLPWDQVRSAPAQQFQPGWYEGYTPESDVQIPGQKRSAPIAIPQQQQPGSVTTMLREQGMANLKKARVDGDAEAQLEWLRAEVKAMEAKHIEELRERDKEYAQELRDNTETVRKLNKQVAQVLAENKRLMDILQKSSKGKEKAPEEESETEEVEYPLTQCN